MKDAFILACRDYIVNNKTKRRHQRKRTEVISPDKIHAVLRHLAFSSHVLNAATDLSVYRQ